MTEQKKKSRWNIEKRLEFIDFRLYWDGRINRSDLTEFFGVSVPQASADLTHYQEAAPKNAVYDKTLKTYVASSEFEPQFFSPSAHRYLAQLRLMEADILDEGEAWAHRLPSCSIAPVIRRRLDPTVLRRILDAIRARAAVQIQYQSMTQSEPSLRWISPHAIAYDGFRWHARAWCHKRNAFGDFVFARIMNVNEGARPSDIDPATDTAWGIDITLRLKPHPGLKGGKRRVVELDFGMTNGVVELKVKLCLAYYLERQFNLHRTPEHPESERQQVVLDNHDELLAARRLAGIDLKHADG